LPLTSVFSWYPDFCRKGRSGPAIGKDGVGRADTDEMNIKTLIIM